MSRSSTAASPPRVLVIGSQGVLGSLLVEAFAATDRHVVRGGRRPDDRPDARLVDLDRPDTVAAAVADTDLVVNAVPDPGLTAERMVLERGGTLVNVSALPVAAGRRLRHERCTPRGTVVMNAGIAPGVTNLVAADLLAAHPEADEVELVLTVSTTGTSGRAGGDFAHRNLTTVGRHRTRTVPLPEPFGTRRGLGFAEPEGAWLGRAVGDRAVSTYVCIAERRTHRALLAVNRIGLISRLPRAAFGHPPRTAAGDASREPVAHWIAVLKDGERIAARTLECRGDYRSAAASTVAFADALSATGVRPGVFDPEDLLTFDGVAPALGVHGITAVERPVTAHRAAPRPVFEGVAP